MLTEQLENRNFKDQKDHEQGILISTIQIDLIYLNWLSQCSDGTNWISKQFNTISLFDFNQQLFW